MHIMSFQNLEQVLKEVILTEPIMNELGPIKDKIIYGFIFGSIAKHVHTTSSDIDLFIIGDVSYKDLSRFSYFLSLELIREINTVIYSLDDFLSKLSKENSFIIDVIQNPKIWLFGDEQNFKKISR